MKQIAREQGEIELKYLENAFINCQAMSAFGGFDPTAAAHEILHVLSPEPNRHDHSQHFSNLLFDRAVGQEPVLWPKRINHEQQTRIFEHQNVSDLE